MFLSSKYKEGSSHKRDLRLVSGESAEVRESFLYLPFPDFFSLKHSLCKVPIFWWLCSLDNGRARTWLLISEILVQCSVHWITVPFFYLLDLLPLFLSSNTVCLLRFFKDKCWVFTTSVFSLQSVISPHDLVGERYYYDFFFFFSFLKHQSIVDVQCYMLQMYSIVIHNF